MILHYKKSSSDWAFSGVIFVSGFAIFALTEVLLTANLIGFFYGFMLSLFLAQISVRKARCQYKKHRIIMKFFIVGPSWVGDMVMSQSLYSALKQQHPNAEIDVLAPAWCKPILERMS